MTPAIGVAAGDQPARDRIRTSLGESLIVEASAGTGKTSELVQRLLSVLQTGVGTIENIAAVTFTHKAAGELKLRLRQKLDEARQSDTDAAQIANLENALKHLEEAAIGTIHAFCAQILRERPVEALVDPAFEELTEGESSRIYERAFRHWFQTRLNQPSPGLRRALVRLAWRDFWDDGPPLERLKKAGRDLIEWRDFPAPWRRPTLEREAEIDALLAQALALAGPAMKPLQEFASRVERAEAAAPRDYDTLEGLLLKVKRDIGRKCSNKQWAGLCASIEDFGKRADADLAATLRDEMRDLVEGYTELKRRAGKLDFNDLLILTRDLLRSNREVRHYLQQRFTHLFVDEFQDTDPLQAEILILLTADDPEEDSWIRATPVPGKLFLVGDPKQSIYKFRRADLTLYESVCGELLGRGAGLVKLTSSFRSLRPIQELVNEAFEPEMAYSPLEQGAPPIADQPSIVALPAPHPYGDRGVTGKAIEACLPDTIAAFTAWLTQKSGWKVRETGELVPVQPRHVAILFRRFKSYRSDVTRDYARALESRDVPHILVGSKSFHDREEVETVRAALAAIEWPDDELSVFATLKGSLFAIPDGLLLRYRHEAGRLHPFRRPLAAEADFAPIVEALDLLAQWHRSRNRQPIAETVNALLEATRAHAGFALRPAGHQVLANVYRIVTLAREFEVSGGISFRAFVEELDAQSKRTESSDAPVLEEGAEGVRLMTVHTAKGLEFPVVILADLTCKLCRNDPERYIDAAGKLCATRLIGCAPEELVEHAAEEFQREQAEGVRVAYVAATRARDLLVVPVVGDEEFKGGWLGPLHKALYPPPARWRSPEPALGCPEFGDRSVLSRPVYEKEECSVKPGLHGKVVWWDPALLRLQVGNRPGLAREEILVEGKSDGLPRYRAWKEGREALLDRGRKKSLAVFTANEAPEPPEGGEVSVELLAKSPGRPTGRRFGTLVHAVMRDAKWDAGPSAVLSLAVSQGRMLGAPDLEVSAAAEAVTAALSHPVMQRASAAAKKYRELPVTLPVGEGRLFEGVLDAAFLENEVWTVVDFKTDADLSSKRSRYERQVQWYVYALARITGQSAKGVLLGI